VRNAASGSNPVFIEPPQALLLAAAVRALQKNRAFANRFRSSAGDIFFARCGETNGDKFTGI
jgi:hypothetical protein